MKHFHRLIFLSLLVFATACAGSAARQHVLIPSMRTSWESIRVAVLREAAAQQHATGAASVAAADEALAAGDPVKIASVDWPVLDLLAEADTARRVVAGAIGPGVAESLRGRLADFAESRALYLTRTRP